MMDWFKSAVVYQIYPRSFMDSSGDGIGDLHGIYSKIDYLKSLGINTLWLCPIYPSPNDDNGYDVSDYLGIHPDFGTLEQFAQLTEKLKSEGIRLVLDMVLNHSSDEHPWFQQSKTSKSNSYSDYYIWNSGRGLDRAGAPIPPNNWTSIFGGSAWEWCQEREQFYLHLFSRKQPDLNWENSEVRKELFHIVETWTKRGVDGFRLDVINFISKKHGFPDVPAELENSPDRHYTCGPRVHEYLQQLYKEVFGPYCSMTVGETPGIDADAAARYCAKSHNELNMIFGFDHMSVDHGPGGIWDPTPIRLEEFFSILSYWQENMERMGGWNSLYVENHDQARFISRICQDSQLLNQCAGALATLLLTLKGTPYIYQGQEIGIPNVAFESIEDYRDIWTMNHYKEALEQGENPTDVLKKVHYRSRDNARTPMHWSDAPNGGFSNGEPWIKINPAFTNINVCRAQKDPDSVLHTYKKLIEIRKKDPVLIEGRFRRVQTNSPSLFAYTREHKSGKRLIFLNFNPSDQPIENITGANVKLVFSSYPGSPPSTQDDLKPYEARLYKLD